MPSWVYGSNEAAAADDGDADIVQKTITRNYLLDEECDVFIYAHCVGRRD